MPQYSGCGDPTTAVVLPCHTLVCTHQCGRISVQCGRISDQPWDNACSLTAQCIRSRTASNSHRAPSRTQTDTDSQPPSSQPESTGCVAGTPRTYLGMSTGSPSTRYTPRSLCPSPSLQQYHQRPTSSPFKSFKRYNLQTNKRTGWARAGSGRHGACDSQRSLSVRAQHASAYCYAACTVRVCRARLTDFSDCHHERAWIAQLARQFGVRRQHRPIRLACQAVSR